MMSYNNGFMEYMETVVKVSSCLFLALHSDNGDLICNYLDAEDLVLILNCLMESHGEWFLFICTSFLLSGLWTILVENDVSHKKLVAFLFAVIQFWKQVMFISYQLYFRILDHLKENTCITLMTWSFVLLAVIMFHRAEACICFSCSSLSDSAEGARQWGFQGLPWGDLWTCSGHSEILGVSWWGPLKLLPNFPWILNVVSYLTSIPGFLVWVVSPGIFGY